MVIYFTLLGILSVCLLDSTQAIQQLWLFWSMETADVAPRELRSEYLCSTEFSYIIAYYNPLTIISSLMATQQVHYSAPFPDLSQMTIMTKQIQFT